MRMRCIGSGSACFWHASHTTAPSSATVHSPLPSIECTVWCHTSNVVGTASRALPPEFRTQYSTAAVSSVGSRLTLHADAAAHADAASPPHQNMFALRCDRAVSRNHSDTVAPLPYSAPASSVVCRNDRFGRNATACALCSRGEPEAVAPAACTAVAPHTYGAQLVAAGCGSSFRCSDMFPASSPPSNSHA